MTKFVSLTALLLGVGLVTWTLGLWSGEDRLAPSASDPRVESTTPSLPPPDAFATRGVTLSGAPSVSSSSSDAVASRLGARPAASTRASKEVFAEDVIARRAMSGNAARKPPTDDAYAN